MYNHLVVNAFPRSGSVYFASFLGIHQVYGAQYTSLHLPYIIGNENVKNVVVVRDPYECLSSLFYKELNHTQTHNHVDKDCLGCQFHASSIIDEILKDNVEEYMQYVDRCLEYNGSKNLYIVDFNKMKKDPMTELENVVNKFGLGYNKVRQDKPAHDIVIDNMHINGMVDDKGGHVPREKTDLRNYIDKKVYDYTEILEAYDKYRYLMIHIKN